MIRRSVRKAFHHLSWIPPHNLPHGPLVFVPNHHGWHDGYVMYHAFTKLGVPVLDWIQEFDSFPLFRSVGGMPFPLDDPGRRAATIRETIRKMREGKRHLLLFAEGVLHRPPEVMEFGKSLDLIHSKVPGVNVIPVAIRYELAMHERPECHLMFGDPVALGPDLRGRTRLAVKALLDLLEVKVRFRPEEFEVLCQGTLDVNERFDMRRITRR